MLFDELMFSNSELLKLQVYKKMLQLECGLHRIEKLLENQAFRKEITYPQLSRLLNKIEADLKEGGITLRGTIVKKGGMFEITKTMPKIDEYRAICLRQSFPFQFLLAALNQTEPTSKDFYRKHNIGRSTLLRKISPLSSYLKSYRISFSHTPLTIVGREEIVRTVVTHLIWIGTRGNEWCFTDLERSEAREAVESHIESTSIRESKLNLLQQLMLVFAVAKTRYWQGHYLEDADPEIVNFFHNSDYFRFEDLKDEKLLNQKDMNTEFSYIFKQLFLLSFLTPFETKELKEERKRFLKNPRYDRYALKITRSILNNLIAQNILSFEGTDRYLMLQMQVLRQTIRFLDSLDSELVPGTDILIYSDSVDKSRKMCIVENALKDYYQTIFREHFPELYSKEGHKAFVSAYKFTIFDEFYNTHRKQTNVRIGVALENIHAFSYLKTVLGEVSIVSLENYDTQKDYDIVIYASSSFFYEKDFQKKDTHYFHMDFEYPYSELHRILVDIFAIQRRKEAESS